MRELAAILTNAVVQRLEARFFESTFGIGDIASVSSHGTAHDLRSAVRATFKNTCVVTGTVATTDEVSDTMKVTHILPRKMATESRFMNDFAVAPEDIDHPKNLLLMLENEEKKFDHYGFCFVPDASHDGTFNKLTFDDGKFSLSQETTYVPRALEDAQRKLTRRENSQSPKKFVFPDFVSRKHVMIHAMDFHRKYNIRLMLMLGMHSHLATPLRGS